MTAEGGGFRTTSLKISQVRSLCTNKNSLLMIAFAQKSFALLHLLILEQKANKTTASLLPECVEHFTGRCGKVLAEAVGVQQETRLQLLH